MAGEQLVGLLGQLKGPQRGPLRGLPRRPGEQPVARVAPAGRPRREHVAAQQQAVERLEHAEDVGRLGRRPLRPPRREHQSAPPAPGHHPGRDPGGVEPSRRSLLGGPCLEQLRQRPQRRQHRCGLDCRAELDDPREQRHEPTDHREPLHEHGAPLPVRVGVGWRDRVGDVGDRSTELGAGHHVLDRLPHQIQRCLLTEVLGGLEQHLHRRGQPARAPGDARVAAQLVRADLPLGPPRQLRAHQHVEQLQSVIDRHGLQRAHRGQQRRRPTGRWTTSQRRRLGRHPIAAQLRDPPGRHPAQVHSAHAEVGNLTHPSQGRDHPLPRWGPWTVSPPVQP